LLPETDQGFFPGSALMYRLEKPFYHPPLRNSWEPYCFKASDIAASQACSRENGQQVKKPSTRADKLLPVQIILSCSATWLIRPPVCPKSSARGKNILLNEVFNFGI
jgi:hypothetical protein